MLSYILATLTGVLVFAIDRITKVFISTNFEMNVSYEFLPGFLDITYINNDGGAWGMLGGYTWLLLSVTVVVMLVCIALLLKYGVKDKLMLWAIMLILSGGLGNMFDRIFQDGNVTDFLHFEFMPSFPVFNVADCAIVLGAALLVVYFFKGLIDESRQKRNASQTSEDSSKETQNNEKV